MWNEVCFGCNTKPQANPSSSLRLPLWFIFKPGFFIQLNFMSGKNITFSLCVCVWGFFLYTSTKSWRGYIFTAVCLCVCLSVCLCVRLCLLTKFQPNECTDLDEVFAKWLLTTLSQTQLKLVTMVPRSKVKATVT